MGINGLFDRTRQLAWIQRNRVRLHRVTAIGDVAERIAQTWVTPDEREAWAHWLAPLVDDEMRRHCIVADVRGRTLALHVTVPTMVWSLQRTWKAALQERLRARAGGPREVTFAYGRDGVAIG